VHRFRLRAGATVPAGTWTFGVQFNHTARSGGPQLDYALLAKPAERGGAALQLSGNF
jgi:hypothetical protein